MDELTKYLKDNLKIEISTELKDGFRGYIKCLEIKLILNNECISSDYISLEALSSSDED